MRKQIAWLCLLILLIGSVADFSSLEGGWRRLDIPVLSEIPLFNLALLILLVVAVSEIFSPGRDTRFAGLSLKRFKLNGTPDVLRIIAGSTRGKTVTSNDHLSCICYIEKKSNSALLIGSILGLVALLSIGLMLNMDSEGPRTIMFIMFLVVEGALLLILLPGKLEIGTADGGVMTFITNKLRADELGKAINQADPHGFEMVSLSSAFTERKAYLRRDQVTGVTEISRVPLFLAFLFLITLVASVLTMERFPLGILVPIILGVMIALLARKRTIAKMIGGHYFALGTRADTERLLGSMTSSGE